MSVNSVIIGALQGYGYPVKPSPYTGTEAHYFTFNQAADSGADFGDNAPIMDILDMQVHFFMPLEENYLTAKAKIRKSLFDAGLGYPSVQMATEPGNKIRHLIFECEYIAESEV